MEKTILSKEVTIQGGQVVVREEAVFNYDKEQVEAMLVTTQRRKTRLVEENKRILAEYDAVVAEEAELKGYLESLAAAPPESPEEPTPIE